MVFFCVRLCGTSERRNFRTESHTSVSSLGLGKSSATEPARAHSDIWAEPLRRGAGGVVEVFFPFGLMREPYPEMR